MGRRDRAAPLAIVDISVVMSAVVGLPLSDGLRRDPPCPSSPSSLVRSSGPSSSAGGIWGSDVG